ncbi:tetratricopeptide repeat protein [Pseudohongiella sp.]|uniref:Uncharacterized protein n=1 Tax=marine sediment metagenome TaxID=412755 RepID=A0A0F9W627_9ZZZZ|nr:tetratricopeptide repeat protein [Pseudohongiella sp.]HDZ08189.1 tetratricopeptide repeat protein [Pseudohongiella sp.]HEA63157.1 tetratricopeptide repeat protein [Pseudohongiella sp.]
MMLRVLLLITSGLLTACAGYQPVSQQPAPVERSEPDTVNTPALVGPPPPSSGQSVPRASTPSSPSPESPRDTVPATASSTLLASVDAAIAAGDLERAAAVSERALRISPRDAIIWYRLADVRYRQQQYADARGLARRALSYAGSDALLRQQISDFIEQLNRL